MSNGNGPDSFRDQNGNHDWASLSNSGRFEADRGHALTPQQHNETRVEFEIRQNAYDWHKQNNGG